MTQVNVNKTQNTVTVSETSQNVVTVAVQGPQGAKGLDLEETNKVDGSVVYYHASSDTFKADATTTKLTLVNGGNF
tara:strand:- start:388 stop:615 length:228 start_codon:yes stop_codon:yes gene_type:complete